MHAVMTDEGIMERTGSEIIEKIWGGEYAETEDQPGFSFAGNQIFGYGAFDRALDGDFKINNERMLGSADKMSIGCLSRSGYCFSPDEKTEKLYEIMKLNPSITEFAVIENEAAVGFMTRTTLNEILGGKYGFTLHSKNPIRDIMNSDFLKVNYYMPIDEVSSLAMQRPFERLYNPIVVELEGKYSGIVTVKDMLDACIRIARAERDEITVMKDNLKIGLFFMDRDYIIQDHYSQFLEEILSEKSLAGKYFSGLLSASFNAKEMESIHDYFKMVFDNTFTPDILDDINPLNEFHYKNPKTNARKVFHCEFSTIEKAQGEVFALVTVYDITAKHELQQRLTEEESRRHEEMKSVFELIQVEPQVFDDFLEDAEYEFERINESLKNETMTAHEALVEIYQSVHAVKSNAVILGLNTFGDKVHRLESGIREMRELQEVPFDDMLKLTLELEKLSQEKDGFKTTLEKINSFKSAGNARRRGSFVLVESLTKTVNKVSRDMGKKVKFLVDEIDDEVIENGPRRIIKEALMQLARNSVVHGIESPEERIARGKNETGAIRLSVKVNGENIHVKMEDDGRGLDHEKIAQKALRLNLIKPEDANDKNALLKVIFSPGFSTAETAGIHAGRGIGLSLVQDRVRSGKGAIKVQTTLGKGTIFNIFFPVKPDNWQKGSSKNLG
ncbi:MAG: CBS domain-containing protein [Treponema sp.]|jgi:two-component system chemotaxis sensor kinase CheA|nr:CBS domain-containing protein [Treponema sp.]